MASPRKPSTPTRSRRDRVRGRVGPLPKITPLRMSEELQPECLPAREHADAHFLLGFPSTRDSSAHQYTAKQLPPIPPRWAVVPQIWPPTPPGREAVCSAIRSTRGPPTS